MEKALFRLFCMVSVGSSAIYLTHDGNILVFIIWWSLSWALYDIKMMK